MTLLGNVWLFSLTIFAVNVLTVGVLTILPSSMIVPFLDLIIFMYRAFTFGVALAPVDEITVQTLIPHSLTILIEFQAYVLVMLAAYLLGKAWLRPGTVGARSHRQGYVHGLRQVGWVSLPALGRTVPGARALRRAADHKVASSWCWLPHLVRVVSNTVQALVRRVHCTGEIY